MALPAQLVLFCEDRDIHASTTYLQYEVESISDLAPSPQDQYIPQAAAVARGRLHLERTRRPGTDPAGGAGVSRAAPGVVPAGRHQRTRRQFT